MSKKRIVDFFASFGVKVKESPLLDNIRLGARILEEKGVMKYKEAIRSAYEILDLAEIAAIDVIKPVTDLKAFFSKLKFKGFKIGIVTLNGKKFAKLVIKRFNLEDLIDVVVTRNDVDNPKPDISQIVYVLKKVNSVPEETAMVGDRPIDMVAAKKAGLLAIGVRTGGIEDKELLKAGADIIIDSIEDLWEVLNIS